MYPTENKAAVEAVAKWWKLTEDQTATAIDLAWWAWRNRKADQPPLVWARWACRQALSGRDLPGVQTSKFREVSWVQGAGMGEVMDRRPGPAQRVIEADDLPRFLDTLTPRERELCDLVAGGIYRTIDLAKKMGVTPPAVTQLRVRVKQKYDAWV